MTNLRALTASRLHFLRRKKVVLRRDRGESWPSIHSTRLSRVRGLDQTTFRRWFRRLCVALVTEDNQSIHWIFRRATVRIEELKWRRVSQQPTPRMSEVTRILERIQRGQPHAAEDLLPLVYDELRRLAARAMTREKPGQTLQPTALVHEAWLRLAGADQPLWDSRGHFFAAAAEAMRRILIERARSKARLRHGGHLDRVDIESVTLAIEDANETVLAIHEALETLAAQDPLKAEVVKMRYFVGMRHGEIARALGVSEATVRRHWSIARAWLYAELKGGSPRSFSDSA